MADTIKMRVERKQSILHCIEKESKLTCNFFFLNTKGLIGFSVFNHSSLYLHHSWLKNCGFHTYTSCLDQFLLSISITHVSTNWVTSDREWKQKKTCFWVIKTKLWWHNGNFPHIMRPMVIVLSRHNSDFAPHQWP